MTKEDTMTQATFAARDYDGTLPQNYEKFFVPAIAAPLAEDLMAAASLRPGEHVLDAACGTGVVTKRAAKRVGAQGRVAGLDVNPGMLSVARTTMPGNAAIEWYETSAEAMPLADSSFDVVLCQIGLQFMPNKLKALQEFRRVLRPGGRVVFNLPGPRPQMFAELAEALTRHIDPECAGFVNVVFSLYDAGELRRLMADAGFDDVAVDRTSRTLSLPDPEEFLWQYIHSTPLAPRVAKASGEQRAALADEIQARWSAFVVGGVLTLDVGVTTLTGR